MQARSAGTSEALVFENKLKHSEINMLNLTPIMFEGQL